MLFIILYNVVPTLESVDEIPNCHHSHKSYWAAISCGTVYYAVHGGSNFWVCGWNPEVTPLRFPLNNYCLKLFWVNRLFSASHLSPRARSVQRATGDEPGARLLATCLLSRGGDCHARACISLDSPNLETTCSLPQQEALDTITCNTFALIVPYWFYWVKPSDTLQWFHRRCGVHYNGLTRKYFSGF